MGCSEEGGHYSCKNLPLSFALLPHPQSALLRGLQAQTLDSSLSYYQTQYRQLIVTGHDSLFPLFLFPHLV